jgi:UDP-N-acetylmuramyl pentapeptide phosphotransferase/UDP-N-acetylglucosamine-1-phosphate transferase
LTGRQRSRRGLALAGGVVIAAGFAIALVEALKLPKGSIWMVVAATVALVALIRWLTRR